MPLTRARPTSMLRKAILRRIKLQKANLVALLVQTVRNVICVRYALGPFRHEPFHILENDNRRTVPRAELQCSLAHKACMSWKHAHAYDVIYDIAYAYSPVCARHAIQNAMPRAWAVVPVLPVPLATQSACNERCWFSAEMLSHSKPAMNTPGASIGTDSPLAST